MGLHITDSSEPFFSLNNTFWTFLSFWYAWIYLTAFEGPLVFSWMDWPSFDQPAPSNGQLFQVFCF